jgi:hypothetical protein
MELDENNVPEEQGEDAVEIYSKWAILGFSTIPSPIFGCVLLVMNLLAAGYKKAVYEVVIFTLIYVVAVNLLINEFLTIPAVINPNVLDKNFVILTLVSFASNLVGGLVLSLYFFKKYFPDKDYYPKSILSPLLIFILLVILTRFVRF